MWSEIACVCLCLLTTYPQRSCCQGTPPPGTTPHLEAIFLGRCYEYSELRYKGILPRVQASCASLYGYFVEAFYYREACTVTMDSYGPFFEASMQELPKDKVMFWSGVYNIAHDYADAGVRMVTLEDTLIGYLVNSLTWCGMEEYPGINYDKCPAWTDCPLEASESFWGRASMTFAASARGKVTLILDGTNPIKPAYRRDSFFGKYELPNLNRNSVTDVQVLIVHNLTKPVINDCQSDNIKLLASDLTAKGFPMTCEDNPANARPLWVDGCVPAFATIVNAGRKTPDNGLSVTLSTGERGKDLFAIYSLVIYKNDTCRPFLVAQNVDPYRYYFDSDNGHDQVRDASFYRTDIRQLLRKNLRKNLNLG